MLDLDPSGSEDEQSDRHLSRRPILRSRRVSSSVDERASSPDYPQSILKRRSSQVTFWKEPLERKSLL